MNDATSSVPDGITRCPWMAPARARELAAAAGDLYHQLREADLARDVDPDPARRSAGWRLDVAAEVCTAPPRSCWTPPTSSSAGPPGGPTSVRCRGAPAPSTRDAAVHRGALLVRHPGCLRRSFHDRLAEPCAEPVTYSAVDADGDRFDLCDGHAIAARASLMGATVIPLS